MRGEKEFKDGVLEENSLHFTQVDLEWARFIINNRAGWNYVKKLHFEVHNLDARYSVVHGRIADGTVASLSRKPKTQMRAINHDELSLLVNTFYPQQWSFHNQDWINSHPEFRQFTVIHDMSAR